MATDTLPLEHDVPGAAATTPDAPPTAELGRHRGTDHFSVGDLMAEYKFTPDLYAQMNVWNVADKRYADQLYPGFAVLGTARTVLVSLGWRY